MQMTSIRSLGGLVAGILLCSMVACGEKEWIASSTVRPAAEIPDPEPARDVSRIPFGVSITENGELVLVDTECLGSYALAIGQVEVDDEELFGWFAERPRVTRWIVVNVASPVLIDPRSPENYEALGEVPADKTVDVVLGFGGPDKMSVRRGDLVPGQVALWDGSSRPLSDYAENCTRGGQGGGGLSMTPDGRLELWSGDCEPVGETSVVVAVNGEQRFHWATEGMAMIFQNPDLENPPWEGVRERSVVMDETNDYGEVEEPGLYRVGDLPADAIIELSGAVILTRGDLSPDVVVTADEVIPKSEYEQRC
jgi:hypothetical protein